MEFYNYIKALHLIFIITWFAGLFYIPRLFIYILEAQNKSKLEKEILTSQFNIMTKRLWYIITWPSAILAISLGLILIYLVPTWLVQQWMIIKLIFVGLLVAYHIKTHFMYIDFKNHKYSYSTIFMRFWNEGATLILFSIVFLVSIKNSFHWIFGVTGIFGLGLLLTIGIRFYKIFNNKNDGNN
ncbi:MAG: protoporphyrinogen IX oxidase [Flavobacteriaceae bacterium]|nr:protoporphyrinogen IX oxidase [Flavobacteriaceae bacterium]